MELHCKHILIWGSVLLSFRTTHQTMNVAPKGTAMQSENPDSASPAAAPHLAIDQKSSPQSYEETCTSVAQQNNPWWQVDLGSIYHVTSVAVISNGDCCPEELDGAEIRIGLKNDTNNHRCAVIAFTQGLYKYNFDCEVTEARFVHVVLPGDGKTLTLCEVQVFGAVLENVAVRGVAFQSSLKSISSGRPSSVVDGNRITTCSITEDKPGQWVKVDLVDPYSVKVIQLAFLEDCCYSPDVWVDDTRCLVMSNSSLTLVTLDCGGVVGRIVTVNHPDVPLTLCEVEVYSTQEHPENTFPQHPARYSYCYPDICSRDLVLVRQTMTWFEGQTYCREKYADLVTIHGAQDMNKVIDVIRMDVSDVWIGLYKDAVTWKWSDGNDTTFRHWGQGQPDNSEAGPNCAHFNGILKAWSASSCDTKSMFFCYYNKEPQDTGLRKFTVRISTDFDMSDTVIQQQIIKQLEMKMKSKGMSDFKIRWGRTIDQNETG